MELINNSHTEEREELIEPAFHTGKMKFFVNEIQNKVTGIVHVTRFTFRLSKVTYGAFLLIIGPFAVSPNTVRNWLSESSGK